MHVRSLSGREGAGNGGKPWDKADKVEIRPGDVSGNNISPRLSLSAVSDRSKPVIYGHVMIYVREALRKKAELTPDAEVLCEEIQIVNIGIQLPDRPF